MTIHLSDDDLALRLAALTRPGDSPAAIWKAAVPAPAHRWRFPALTRTVPHGWIALAASILFVAALTGVMLPSLGKARSSARVSPSLSPSLSSVEPYRFQGESKDAGGAIAGFPVERYSSLGRASQVLPPSDPPARGASSMTAPADTPRQVIRKATLELTTPDVRAALLKAGLILNLATGEYTEQSSLTGDGPTAQATLTLRIAAPRLSEALNQLRALGKVTSEQLTGDDVTDQAVDLEARLRNEQRIESELLTLLDSRKDSPLEDILKVRTQLAEIRETIERLTAQRDRLSQLVSLATILVIIRADTAPPPEPIPSGIWDYFKANISASWHAGLANLADTIAALLRLAVGGLIWWLLLLTLFLTTLHLYRRSRAAAAIEPVPTE